MVGPKIGTRKAEILSRGDGPETQTGGARV
jgi:hypothetical protein